MLYTGRKKERSTNLYLYGMSTSVCNNMQHPLNGNDVMMMERKRISYDGCVWTKKV